METHNRSNGIQTFVQHWGLTILPVAFCVATHAILYLTHLSGLPWLVFFCIGVGLGVAGIGLLAYAKYPLYRQHRYFTFGSRSLPSGRRCFYIWGYRCAALSLLLLMALTVSQP